MGREVAIGAQDFGDMIRQNCFLVDKSGFIKEWWENGDAITLITRPRRFGKTLNMSMLDYFFSIEHREDAALFEGLKIWEEQKYHKLQGSFPVITLSFTDVKQMTFPATYVSICYRLFLLYKTHYYLLDGDRLTDDLKRRFKEVQQALYMDYSQKCMERREIVENALRVLCQILMVYYGQRVILLLDEYDTPLQEAWLDGYSEEMSQFIHGIFRSVFKANPYLERAILTGITCIPNDGIFSDLNSFTVITTTSDKYATCFGFTEREVFDAMDEMGLNEVEEVKRWYDGFTFGNTDNIYNPWSITCYLKSGQPAIYWANSSGNAMVSKLLREGSTNIKKKFETLLTGKTIATPMEERIVFSRTRSGEDNVWSMLVASGYLRMVSRTDDPQAESIQTCCELAITNGETLQMFHEMVRGWFWNAKGSYNDFVKAMFAGDLRNMNICMNQVVLECFSYFDPKKNPVDDATERFYHSFVMGLLVQTYKRYELKTYHDSGRNRYDVIFLPLQNSDYGYIYEFKIFDEKEENSAEDTVEAALAQIEEKGYETELMNWGVPGERIRKYGVAFVGKRVLIGQ